MGCYKVLWLVVVPLVVITCAISAYEEEEDLDDNEIYQPGERKGKISKNLTLKCDQEKAITFLNNHLESVENVPTFDLPSVTTDSVNKVFQLMMREPVFPFVSIVRFANTDCASSTSMNGTCLARRECNNLNGTITGTCATRRGRCCVVTRTCGGTTNVNNTYFVSPGYPAAYAGGQACSIIVNRCNNNICQLRIDFLDMVLAQPDGDGNCAIDSVTVTGGNTIVPTICGDNTGQTIFVDFDATTNNAITITVTATLATVFARRWNIRLTQLGCDCPGLAPNGCLQYYTGLMGTINSFNYGMAANTLLSASLVTGTRQIANLNYGICIRMEAGYCAIQYAQAVGDMFSFTVTGDVEGADVTVLGTQLGAVNDGACVTDFVVVPNPIVVATGLPVGTDRFCGLGFVPIQTALKPFVLYVTTDANEGATAVTPPDVANRGFSLNYVQIAC